MTRIVLSADAELVRQARAVARRHRKTLNEAFREWLMEYVAQSSPAVSFDALMNRLSHVRAGKKFSRQEMNS